MQGTIQSWAADFISLIYPNVCQACSRSLHKGEEVICMHCRYFLPKTYFHLERGNPVEKLFWGRVDLHFATSYYYFSKGSKVQSLLHGLKYKNRKEIGITIGQLYGKELIQSDYLHDIDLIIPVPLHPKKQKKRGYNQSDLLAQGLSVSLQKPWEADILKRVVANPTQTRKKRYERWENVADIFKVKNKYVIKNKHVLLVDDLVTTGSTLEAGVTALLDAGYPRVSVATIACALRN